MPRYEFVCYLCGHRVERHASMRRIPRPMRCKQCGQNMCRVWTFNLKTDTSFVFTGAYDNRLCASNADRIQGRKDYQRRLDQRGLIELDWHTVMNMKQPKPEAFFPAR